MQEALCSLLTAISYIVRILILFFVFFKLKFTASSIILKHNTSTSVDITSIDGDMLCLLLYHFYIYTWLYFIKSIHYNSH